MRTYAKPNYLLFFMSGLACDSRQVPISSLREGGQRWWASLARSPWLTYSFILLFAYRYPCFFMRSVREAYYLPIYLLFFITHVRGFVGDSHWVPISSLRENGQRWWASLARSRGGQYAT